MARRTPVIATVILPVRDMSTTIDAQLHALRAQRDAPEWELIVVDNGSRDDSAGRVEAATADFAALRIVRAPGPASSGHARNVGAEAASGRCLLFCDADDEVSPGWVAAMVAGLERDPLVTGPLDHNRLNARHIAAAVAEFGSHEPPLGYDFLPYALTCNLGVRRDVFESLHGFDATLRSGGDMEFSWRAQLAGHRLAFSQEAVVHRRLPAAAFGQFRRQLRYSRTAPVLYKRYAAAGMPRSSVVRAGAHLAFLAVCSPAVFNAKRRYRWAGTVGHRIGRIVGSAQHRSLYP